MKTKINSTKMIGKMLSIEINHKKLHLFMTILTATLICKAFSGPLMTEYEQHDMKFRCPEMTNSSCSCSFIFTDYEFQCPAFDPKIIVKVQPNIYVYVDCNRIEPKDYTLLPAMYVGDIPMVQMRRCPLPFGQPIKTLLDRLGTRKLRALLFQVYDADLGGPLLRDHFKGLQDLERLVISVKGVTQLPNDLFADLRNLTWLDLRSPYTHFPKDLFKNLEKLDSLELGGNKLDYLEDGIFHNQQRLKHLNLWGNNLRNLSKQTFDGLSSVTELDLSANNISTLPHDIFSLLKNLTNLNLNANRFIELPEGLFSENKNLMRFRMMENRIPLRLLPNGLFSNLSNLQDIRIKCYLEQIPDNLFSGSKNLHNISLAGNNLKQLPSNLLADQNNLLVLDLSQNLLSDLPNDLFANTRSLIVLSLSYNNLVYTSSNLFSNLQELRELYLDNNKLHRIHPNAFASTRALQVIDVHNNELSFKDEESELIIANNFDIGSPFQNLDELRILNLRNNSISNIYRDWLFNTPQLQELDLSYNNISLLYSNDLQFISKNIKVNLTHNSIKEIDFHEIEILYPSDNDLTKIVEVYIESNPIICDCIIFHFIQFLRKEFASHVSETLKIIPGNLQCASPIELEGKLITEIHPEQLLCPLDVDSTSIKRCPTLCTCMVRLYDKALIIKCSNVGLRKIPALPRVKALKLNFISLYIENNLLIQLPHADLPGYADVKELYAKHNNISELNIENIPKNLERLDLSYNNLTWINNSVLQSFNHSTKLKLSLGNNPWMCNCKTLGLLSFVRTNFKMIQDLDKMHCTPGGKKLSLISPEDMCSNKIIVVAVSVTIAIFGLIIGIFAALYYKYQKEIKVWLFAHNLCLWFVTEEELDKDKKYDAFISYSHKDEDFITEHLVPILENEPNSFKLCIHIRDFVVGEFIPNQIVTSVEESRRTIVVLSQNFLESIWGRMEFRAAHMAAITEKRTRVIIIIYGDIGNIDCLDPELKAYLKMNTYVKWGDPWFWDKLRYAMPHRTNLNGNNSSSNGKTKGLIKNTIKSSTDDKLELIKPTPVTSPSLTTPPVEQATKNPLTLKLNGDLTRYHQQNGSCYHMSEPIPNGHTPINGHINGAFIINTNAKQSDV